MSEVKYKTRRVCFEVLRRIAVDKAYSNLESANLYNNYGLSINDRRFVKTLVFGVLERQLLLDYIIALFVNKKPDIETRLLLRIGLQQIMFMEVPPSAACDETVDVAKNVLDKSRAGFVNAVLRNICRNEKKVRDAVEKAEGYIKYSVSESIYGLLKEQYGETAEDILKSFYDKKTLFLRVNTLKTTAEELCDKLGSEGAEAVKVSDGTIEIIKGGGTAVRMIDGGEFFIQGLGSQYAVESLCATGGQTVIDVCASPGGKSLGAAID
ncbi:MAG TPA: hypothetical protein DD733_06535, partial [Clostridiales bacterium]|nr:hypothetical protein [Clostridiales bacterium]